MTNRLERQALYPHPVRRVVAEILKRSRLGSYAWRLRFGAVERPFYGYIVYQAAHLAGRLGYPAISVREFGVGTGAGLQNPEEHAREVSRLFPVEPWHHQIRICYFLRHSRYNDVVAQRQP